MSEQKKDTKLSENFQKREAEIKAEEAAKPLKQETVYFVSKASACQIGNFREEVRSNNDRVIVREKSLDFSNNIRPVDKHNLRTKELSEEYVFLAGDKTHDPCNALLNGDIFEFSTKEEANKKIRAMLAIKNGQKNIEIEDVQVDTIKFGSDAVQVNKVSSSATG